MRWNLLIRRRDDLPEMRWPLVLAVTAAACFFSTAAVGFRGEAMFLTVPFLVMAAAAFTSLILLWRRLLALGAAVLIGIGIALTGSSLPAALTWSLCLLAVSYVYATLFLSRETRFVRITATACTIGICILLTGLAWISFRFESIHEAILYYAALLREPVLEGYQALSENLAGAAAQTAGGVTVQTVVLRPEDVDAMFYQAVVTIPALLGIFCTASAAMCDFCIGLLFRLLDCADYFLPEADRDITMPKSFAVLYAVSLFLVTATSWQNSPHLYSILSNCCWVFALPCAWVGLTKGCGKLRDSMEEASLYSIGRRAGRHSRFSAVPALLVTVFMFVFLGLSTAFTLVSVMGAAFVVMKETPGGDDRESE